MHREKFDGRVLVIGCGAVAQCTLPLLLRHLDMPPQQITVVDFVDNRHRIRPALEAGVKYVCERITRSRFDQQLSSIVGAGDLIIDLAWNLGCIDLLEWCHRHGVLYINTSVELWDPRPDDEAIPVRQRTLYARQMEIRSAIEKWHDRPGSTAVLEHGANPGLVSHFTKLGLCDIADRMLENGTATGSRASAIETAISQGAFNRLAQLLGVKVIHISERDTQATSLPVNPHQFVNTWSIEGFFEEAIAPSEMGWGTHEETLPEGAVTHRSGPCNQICLQRRGMDTFVRSCVPSAEIEGMVIRHGEAFSISEYLSVQDALGDAVYRPTVHYAYHPCPAAMESINQLRNSNYQLQPEQRIMSDDIVSGWDELGCLLMGHDLESWWTGTVLDIDETRRLVSGHSATTLQVAASVLSAVCWMIRNPRRGILLPDYLPHAEILKIARPYLGQVISEQLAWTPTKSRNRKDNGDVHSSWQFAQFLLPERPTNPLPQPTAPEPYTARMAVARRSPALGRGAQADQRDGGYHASQHARTNG